MSFENKLINKTLGFVMAILAIALLTSCGSNQVRGEPPMVRLNELSHQDGAITLELNMRNVNEAPLVLLAIDVKLSVDDNELLSYKGSVDTDIVANGIESWSVDVSESDTSRELLNKLENGEINSLPYSLKGSISSQDDGTLRFEHEGHIYPLPGRPGHFR